MKVREVYQKVVIEGIEHGFYRWGGWVALNPLKVIFSTLLIPILASLGFILFRVEYATDRLWVPSTSPFRANKAWSEANFESTTRWNNVLFQGQNILTPESVKLMYSLHEEMALYEFNGKSHKDICLLVPVQDLFFTEPKKEKKTDSSSRHRTVSTSTPSALSTSTSGEGNVVDDKYGLWPDYDISTPADSTTKLEDDSSGIWPDYEEEEVKTNSVQVIPNKEKTKKNKTENDENAKDKFDNLPPDIFCGLVTRLPKRCFQGSILELWEYDKDRIDNITEEEILFKINTVTTNPWLRNTLDFEQYLGGIVRNESGHIVGASATWIQFMNRVPDDAEYVEQGGLGIEFEKSDWDSLVWEQHLIEVCEKYDGRNGTTVLPHTSKSFNDISFQAVFFDLYKMGAGYVIMYFYTAFMLGKINWLETRVFLAGIGIFSCILGLGAAFGLTFLLGFEYNQTHNVLPFIAIGIGIDDVFVIMECWHNVFSPDVSLEENIAKTMKIAGVAVTVTSLTDVLAFSLGAFTIMPGLQSFCVSAAICIAFVFFLQISWFVAWLTIDQRRISMRRNAIIPCFKVAPVDVDSKPDIRINLAKQAFSMYSSLLKYRASKAIVLLATAALLAMGVYGSVNIEQRFEADKMLPRDSHLRRWIEHQKIYFPTYGLGAKVYTGPLDYRDLQGMDEMVSQFEELSQPGPERILRIVESWWTDFRVYLVKNNMTVEGIQDQDTFSTVLSDFLFSVDNARYQYNFKFDGDLKCGTPAPNITATLNQLWYGMSSSLPPPSEYLPAKSRVDIIIQNANFSTAFAISPIYQAWETDEIIAAELWRNLALALLATAIVSWVFLTDFVICLFVMLCVLLTLVDLVGVLHFWDVTIDVLSCVNIVLATGLSVDYSVHLAHSFLVATGSRESRVQQGLISLGPAILNGGITTFLALALLPFSQSQVFIIFFKVFGLTVLFGLFHGLMFLPVVLSLIGPQNRETTYKADKSTPNDNTNPAYEDDSFSVRL